MPKKAKKKTAKKKTAKGASTPKRVTITINVTEELKSALQVWCEQRGTDANAVVRPFLESLIAGEEIDTETRNLIREVCALTGLNFQDTASLCARYTKSEHIKRALLAEAGLTPEQHVAQNNEQHVARQ